MLENVRHPSTTSYLTEPYPLTLKLYKRRAGKSAKFKDLQGGLIKISPI
jgi:hypothetical protein